MNLSIYFLLLIFLTINLSKSSVKTEDSMIYPEELEDLEYDENINNKIKRQKCDDFVGTNLFGNDGGSSKKCFSNEEVALLTARRDFEALIPKDFPKCILNDELIEIFIQYFYGIHQIICKTTAGSSKIYAQKAFYDTLGGYLNHYLYPVTKYSFYAGKLSLKTALNVLELYRQCKIFLNTYGGGWKSPLENYSEFDQSIEPFHISSDKDDHRACVSLMLADERSENDDDMIVSLPKLDPLESGELSNIWLPFKRKRTFNIKSNLSAFVLLKYYTIVTRCYAFQGICQDRFNKKLKDWLQDYIEIHFNDDSIYPGLGGVLRVLETIKHHRRSEINRVSEIDNLKDQDKRNSKSQNFKNVENKAEKEQNHISNNGNDDSSFMDKLFGKTKHQSSSKEGDFITYEDDDDDDPSLKQKRREYRIIAFVIVGLLLLFILVVAVITKYTGGGICQKDDKKPSNEKERKKKIKNRSFVDKFKKQKKGSCDEETILLRCDSPAIMSAAEGSKNNIRKKSVSYQNISNSSFQKSKRNQDISSSESLSSPKKSKIPRNQSLKSKTFVPVVNSSASSSPRRHLRLAHPEMRYRSGAEDLETSPRLISIIDEKKDTKPRYKSDGANLPTSSRPISTIDEKNYTKPQRGILGKFSRKLKTENTFELKTGDSKIKSIRNLESQRVSKVGLLRKPAAEDSKIINQKSDDDSAKASLSWETIDIY